MLPISFLLNLLLLAPLSMPLSFYPMLVWGEESFRQRQSTPFFRKEIQRTLSSIFSKAAQGLL